ncbi:hypothetical protein COP2_015031 [Malus domestica]
MTEGPIWSRPSSFGWSATTDSVVVRVGQRDSSVPSSMTSLGGAASTTCWFCVTASGKVEIDNELGVRT